jgi:pimeloyl-ACP methyl ester carboxylesterase
MWPVDLAVDARGDLVVSGDHPMEFYSPGFAAGQVVVFSPERKPLLTLKDGAGQPLFFPQATVDRAGNILVQDGNSELLSFSPTGTLVSHWELWSGGSGGFVRVAPSGQVYASGCFGTDCRIVEVGPTGEAVRTWDFTGPADHPGSKVATGQGYDLYLQCAGSGSPTVVLEAGSGMGGSFMFPGYLLGRLATTTRVCLYDRAGLGLSDNAHEPADTGGPQMIADLHAVLHAADVPGPYVMVGHSLGGPLNRLFAATYPQEVVGMVQVDGSSEASLRYRGCTDASCDMYSLITALDDAIHGKVAGSLGALPLVVISHDPALPFLVGTADTNWETAQEALATASSNAVHVDATLSSHYIPWTQPGLVIEAVREVVAAARAADHSLPKCGAAFTKLGGKCL